MASILPYVVVHNRSVQPHQTVLTGSWWRFFFAALLGKLGIKVATERKADYEKGAPVELLAMGAADANQDNVNLLKARQSPGYLLLKDLIADMSERRADKVLIESVAVFDQFAGEKAETQMGAGKKSLAITVRLQPRDKTLTDEEIEAVSAKIVEKVTKATGGVLRG